jgi:signal transduction histidine kinase
MDKNVVMSHGPADPRWPKLLSLAVHEFRTPITVAAGYIRMLLKDRAGPITDQQRRLLEEAEKSCGRLSALVAEMSDLSGLEGGTATLNRATLDLGDILQQAVAALPPAVDREIAVDMQLGGSATVSGDATRLRTAMTSILTALRRELVTTDQLLVRSKVRPGVVVIAIGDAEQVAAIEAAAPETLTPFNEWRGGSGLSLAIARRIIVQHGGALLAPPGEANAGAAVVLPIS